MKINRLVKLFTALILTVSLGLLQTAGTYAASVDAELTIEATIAPKDGQTSDITNNDLMTMQVTITNNGPDDLVGGNYSVVVANGAVGLNNSSQYTAYNLPPGLTCSTVVSEIANNCEFGSADLDSGGTISYSFDYLFQTCNSTKTVGQTYSTSDDGLSPRAFLLPGSKINSSGGYEAATTTDTIVSSSSGYDAYGDFNYKYIGCDFNTGGEETSNSTASDNKTKSPKTGAEEVLVGLLLVTLVASSFLIYKAVDKHRSSAKLSEK